MDKSVKPRRFVVDINRKWCKDCGICVAFCPAHVFETGGRGEPVIARPDDCTGCQLCVLRCPDLAVDVEEAPAAAGGEGVGGEGVGAEPVHAGQ